MATIGSEILSYSGNPLQGLGSNADVPAIYTDYNVINQTGRDLMQMNQENNILKYKQKIADRDKQLEMIANGQVKTGEILEQDRPVIKQYQDKADKAFLEMTKAGGINNKEAYLKYSNALKDLNDATTHAQYRWLGRKELEKEQSSQTLKSDQQAYQEHINNQDKKGFYSGDYKPFQKSLDYNADEIFKTGWNGVLGTPQTDTTNKQVVKTSPDGKQTTVDVKTTKPLTGTKAGTAAPVEGADITTGIVKRNGKTYQVTQSQIDFNKIRQNQIAAYADENGKQFENQTKHREIFETAPDEVFEPYMQHIVKRVTDYNNDKGLVKGEVGYLDPNEIAQKLGLDANGKRTGQKIMMSTPDFAALTALADYNGSYAPKSETWMQKEDEFDLKKQEEANKILAAKIAAGAKITAARYNKEGKIRVQELKNARGQQSETGLHNVFDDAVGMSTSNKDGTYTVKVSDLPEGYQTFMGGIKVDATTGKTTVSPLKPRPDGTYKISNGAFMNGILLNDFQINEARDAYNKKYGTNLSGAKFLYEMSKSGLVKIAPAYLVGDKGQTVDLNQILDAQKIVIQPTVKKSEQVPTEITIDNSTSE